MSDELRHGGAIDKIAKMFTEAPTPWVDLSTGINPWPYPVEPGSLTSLEKLPTNADYERCRNALSTSLNAPEDNIVLAPGSELLISLLPSIISPSNLAILSPTYGDHVQRWRSAGAEVTQAEAPLELADGIDAVVVCNPNNPDGRGFSIDDLETARKKLAARGGFLIVDEAFADLTPEQSMAAHGGKPGLIILRSFGKFYGLPGLRLGAIIAPKNLCEGLSARLGAWPVSGMALEIGARAFKDEDWQAQTQAKLAAAAHQLDEILKGGGLNTQGGSNLFRFVETPDAADLWQKLAKAGIYVRRFSWSNSFLRFGLPSNEEEQDRLEQALAL